MVRVGCNRLFCPRRAVSPSASVSAPVLCRATPVRAPAPARSPCTLTYVAFPWRSSEPAASDLGFATSRRGCRRRSGRRPRARPRSAGTALWQVAHAATAQHAPTEAAINAPVFSSCRWRSSTPHRRRRPGTALDHPRTPAAHQLMTPPIRSPARLADRSAQAQGLGEQAVAGQDGHVLAVGHVAGGLAARSSSSSIAGRSSWISE